MEVQESLWKILRHYGVPERLVSLIRNTHQDMWGCHAGQTSDSFYVKTGVRQGCLLSLIFFLFVIDWIMGTTRSSRNNGILLSLLTQLNDLDFADGQSLLSKNHSQIQDKTTLLTTTSTGTGLQINLKKNAELMKINTTARPQDIVGSHQSQPIREIESFIYLGSWTQTVTSGQRSARQGFII